MIGWDNEGLGTPEIAAATAAAEGSWGGGGGFLCK